MIILRGRKFQTCAKVIGHKKRVVGQNFFPTRSVCEQLQNIFHSQPIASDAGTPSAFAGLGGDSVEKRAHGLYCAASGNRALLKAAGKLAVVLLIFVFRIPLILASRDGLGRIFTNDRGYF